MKFKVGQVWEDGNGEAIWIESVTGEGLFRDVLQPVVGRDISGYIWCYTENGYHGHTEENLRVDNLVRLISEPAEEAEPEVSEETDTPPVTLELMQEFTAADEPASEPTIEPGEEFGRRSSSWRRHTLQVSSSIGTKRSKRGGYPLPGVRRGLALIVTAANRSRRNKPPSLSRLYQQSGGSR